MRSIVPSLPWALVVVSLPVFLTIAVSFNSEAQIQEREAGHRHDSCEAAIKRFRDAHSGGARGPTAVIDNEDVKTLFPGFCFGIVRYRTAKVKAPEPLGAHNLIAVDPEGKARRLANTKDLEKLFRARVKDVRDDARACAIVRAWLRLAQEIAQKDDRLITFELDRDSLRSSLISAVRTASGRAIARRGGTGQVHVRMIFGANGRITKIDPTDTAEPHGERPA